MSSISSTTNHSQHLRTLCSRRRAEICQLGGATDFSIYAEMTVSLSSRRTSASPDRGCSMSSCAALSAGLTHLPTVMPPGARQQHLGRRCLISHHKKWQVMDQWLIDEQRRMMLSSAVLVVAWSPRPTLSPQAFNFIVRMIRGRTMYRYLRKIRRAASRSSRLKLVIRPANPAAH